MQKFTDAHQIQHAIMAGKFTNDELTAFGQAIQFARASMAKQVKRQLTLGATVSFNSSRTGLTHGTITKIGIKKATVRTSNGLWQVPMNMLSVA
jgi:hypothetical protein